MIEVMSADTIESLLLLGKLLLDEDRLKIMGCLARQPAAGPELARQLKQKPAMVNRHLAKLQAVDLVQVSAQGQYRLNLKQLTAYKQRLFLTDSAPSPAGQTPEERMLGSFIEGERLKQIPAKRAKLQLVLAWLAEKFELDVYYPERAVNEIIQQHHPDYASLRRFLVDHGLMKREKGIYWRTGPT